MTSKAKPGKGDEREVLAAYLRDHGHKMTEPREAVLEAFLGIESHVTAEELYDATLKIDPGIGQATVFRTIKLLMDAGLAREACRDDGPRRYEHAYRHEHHDHLVCINCGAMIEFRDQAVENAQVAVYEKFGYTPSGHHFELYGTCPSCRTGKRT